MLEQYLRVNFIRTLTLQDLTHGSYPVWDALALQAKHYVTLHMWNVLTLWIHPRHAMIHDLRERWIFYRFWHCGPPPKRVVRLVVERTPLSCCLRKYEMSRDPDCMF